jgi:L-fuculokinase
MKKACLVFDVLPHAMNLTVFDQELNVLYKSNKSKKPLVKELGHKVEDLKGITEWLHEGFNRLKKSVEFEIVAINFNSYIGALVHLDANNFPVFPVLDINENLNYKTLKIIEAIFEENNYDYKEVQIAELSFETAALQLLYIREVYPLVFKKIKKSVSLAQYFQSIFTDEYFHDYSTIGSHSAAWNFETNQFHNWIKVEKLDSLNLPVKSSDKVIVKDILIGPGMYHKVAETLPFMTVLDEPFILLSTGAWAISVNPFNHSSANKNDLKNNCFNILNQNGERIKMARLFSGNEHSRQLAHLAKHYKCDTNFCLSISYDSEVVRKLRQTINQVVPDDTALGTMLDSPFMDRNLNDFSCIEEAYHQFIMDLVAQQVASIKLTIGITPIIRKIIVDGGLAKNETFMQLLSEAFHDKRTYKVGFNHTAALGAAMAIGTSWGAKKPSEELLQIELIE